MDKKTQKIKYFISQYLGKSKAELINKLGIPVINFDEETLLYKKKK